MENFLFVYLLVNFVSLIPIAYAADKRTVGTGWAVLVSLIFSPLIGFLFILCHPSKAEIDYQQRMIRIMNDLPDRLGEGTK